MKNKRMIVSMLTTILMVVMIIGMYNVSIGVTGANLNRTFDQDATPTQVNNLVNNSIYNAVAIMRIIGVSASLTILFVISARFMLAAPSEKAEIKKQSVAFVIGAFLLFAATSLISIVVNLANTIGK